MLKLTHGQNIGVCVGAALNVLMTLFNHMPAELRPGAITGMVSIAAHLTAMNGVKQ